MAGKKIHAWKNHGIRKIMKNNAFWMSVLLKFFLARQLKENSVIQNSLHHKTLFFFSTLIQLFMQDVNFCLVYSITVYDKRKVGSHTLNDLGHLMIDRGIIMEFYFTFSVGTLKAPNQASILSEMLYICFQYNTQHIMPLEDVKLESVDDDGSKYTIMILSCLGKQVLHCLPCHPHLSDTLLYGKTMLFKYKIIIAILQVSECLDFYSMFSISLLMDNCMSDLEAQW